MTEVKTAQDALDALRTVTEGREYFVYEAPDGGYCVNFERDGDDDLCPSCVVGHVLVLWGLPEGLWSVFRSGPVRHVAGDMHKLHEPPFVLSPAAISVLGVAQQVQDNGSTWGEAVERAVDYFDEHYGSGK